MTLCWSSFTSRHFSWQMTAACVRAGLYSAKWMHPSWAFHCRATVSMKWLELYCKSRRCLRPIVSAVLALLPVCQNGSRRQHAASLRWLLPLPASCAQLSNSLPSNASHLLLPVVSPSILILTLLFFTSTLLLILCLLIMQSRVTRFWNTVTSHGVAYPENEWVQRTGSVRKRIKPGLADLILFFSRSSFFCSLRQQGKAATVSPLQKTTTTTTTCFTL